jgi:hypothetical protein
LVLGPPAHASGTDRILPVHLTSPKLKRSTELHEAKWLPQFRGISWIVIVRAGDKTKPKQNLDLFFAPLSV